MTGRVVDRIASLASRLLREETFRHIAAPAIADLQHEVPTVSGVRLVRSYAGALRALAMAGGHDMRANLSEAFDVDAVRVVWLPAAAVATGLSLLVILFNGVTTDARYRSELLATVLATMAVAFAPIAMAPGAFALSRRGTGHRGALAAAVLVITTLSWVSAFGMRPTRERLELQLEASRWHVAAADGAGMAQRLTAGQSPAETARMLDGPIRTRERAQRGFWSDLRYGLSVPVLALLGVALARRRGWMVPVCLVAMAMTWMVLMMTLTSLGIGRNLDTLHQGWSQMAIGLIVATGFLGVPSLVSRRVRQQARHSG